MKSPRAQPQAPPLPTPARPRRPSPTERAVNGLRLDLYFVAIVIIAAVLVLKLG